MLNAETQLQLLIEIFTILAGVIGFLGSLALMGVALLIFREGRQKSRHGSVGALPPWGSSSAAPAWRRARGPFRS